MPEVVVGTDAGVLLADECGDPYRWIRDASGHRECLRRKQGAAMTLAVCRFSCYTLMGRQVSLRGMEDMITETRLVRACDVPCKDAAQAAGRPMTATWQKHPSGQATKVACDLAGHLKACLVSAASAYRVGGAFLEGRKHGQEESLCMQSSLYPSLMAAQELAQQQRISPSGAIGLGPDGAPWQIHIPEDGVVLSPKVEVFRGPSTDGYPFQARAVMLAAVVSIAMPNCNPQVPDMPVDRPHGEYEYLGMLRQKFIALLGAALAAGAVAVVMPDAGCGVSMNRPLEVGRAFGEVVREHFPDSFQELHVVGAWEFCDAAIIAAGGSTPLHSTQQLLPGHLAPPLSPSMGLGAAALPPGSWPALGQYPSPCVTWTSDSAAAGLNPQCFVAAGPYGSPGTHSPRWAEWAEGPTMPYAAMDQGDGRRVAEVTRHWSAGSPSFDDRPGHYRDPFATIGPRPMLRQLHGELPDRGGTGGVWSGRAQDLEPQTRQVLCKDPRDKIESTLLGVVAFSKGERVEPCDKLCTASFLGSYYDLGPYGLRVAVSSPSWWGCCSCLSQDVQTFRNAEAAFHSLKFWRAKRAPEFEHLTGAQAAARSEQMAGSQDTKLAGFTTEFLAMLHVLRAKFLRGSELATALKRTAPDFLLHHGSFKGDDPVWSDDFDGNGSNWLGLQLMLVRDELHWQPEREEATQRGEWTLFIESCLDTRTGAPVTAQGGRLWQEMVSSAALAVRKTIAEVCKPQGAGPTINLPGFVGFCQACKKEECAVQ